jgi:hypothetical protein
MPVIRFIQKKCICSLCSDCNKNISSNSNKKKVRINTYILTYLEGLKPFNITKL